VWRAEDLELGRRVALKLLGPSADPARFEREARAVASLAHPNITQVYDYGEWQGRPYMLLEYLPGGTLEDRLVPRKPLPDEETLAIATGIAAGLAHAHSRGVVHRDLKPANVLFDDEGRPKLADFGIARLAAGDGTLTEAGTVLGTAAYISPEQATGEPATAASDVYSFGVILYRMLTGRLPFESADPMELVMLHRNAAPPPIAELRRDAPAALAATATASLAKSPRNRPADGAALAAALGGAPTTAPTAMLGAEATQVLPRSPDRAPGTAATVVAPGAAVAGTPPPPRRSRMPIIAAALLLLAVGGGALAYAVTRPSSPSVGTASTTTQRTHTRHTTSQATTTAAPPPTTTQQTTTAQTTTHAQTTTAPTTAPTPPTTIAPPVTTELPPTTTALPPTTAPPTTIATTLTTP
jgi:serine/threonine-protein kinase